MIALNKLNLKKISFLLTVILIIFFGYEIGNRHFADPDEGRYVEIPREMVVTNDFITPRLNGLKYFEKPPLLYWLQAITIKTIGINETSMRLWHVFFAVLGCLSLFFVGRSCGSVTTGLLGAGILATNVLYYAHSRIIILDLPVAVLMCASLWCFFLAFVREPKKINSEKQNDKINNNEIKKQNATQKKLVVAMYAFAALACLTKGLIGAVLPGFVAFLWVCFTNNWKKVPQMISLLGIIVFLAIFLPWHIAVCMKNPDFFNFYFIHEHFLRYTTQIHGRYQPMWIFIPIIIAGLLPWTGFSLVALNNTIKSSVKNKNPENIFFSCWILGIFCFFSLSNSKLIPYILPIVPPMCYITAKMLTNIDVAEKNFKIGTSLNFILFGIAAVAFLLAKKQINDVINAFPEVNILLITFGITIIISLFVLTYTIKSKKQIDNSILIYVFVAMNMLWIINKAAPFYQDIKKPSTKHLAKVIRMNKQNDDLVLCYGRYLQDFPVYLQSTIGFVVPKLENYYGELKFGNEAEKNDKIIEVEKMLEIWKENKRIFMLLTRDDYRQIFSSQLLEHVIVDFDKNFVVISNK